MAASCPVGRSSLTHLRYLGYCFNPVSFFYCFDCRGTLRAVVAEVHNTYGGAANYWLEPDAAGAQASSRPGPSPFRAAAHKRLYVSPFMPAEIDYTFVLTPHDRLTVHMKVHPRVDTGGLPTGGGGQRIFDATLLTRASSLDDARTQPPAAAATGGHRQRHGRHPLAGLAFVVEGCAFDCRDPTMIEQWTKRAFLAGLRTLTGGSLELTCDGVPYRFGDVGGGEGDGRGPEPLAAVMVVSNDCFFSRALRAGDIGIGESFMDGDWHSPELVTLARLMLRNMPIVERQGGILQALTRFVGGVARRLRDNSLTGSRRHIREHYDLGNDFFRIFLDEHFMYSCACYETGHESLEQAQHRKLNRICCKLDLGPDDHLLEIGSGWGGFAVWAATRYGCRVTTTTISDEQYRYASAWVAGLGENGGRIEVLRQDYRQLTGQFDKIVSIEMFEAVGLDHYDDYFAAVNRLLKPDGSMLLQTITVDEQWFPHYHGQPDWIEKVHLSGRRARVNRRDRQVGRTGDLVVAASCREHRHALRADGARLA